MTDQTARFLATEELATRLVSQLQDLKVSMEAHAEASTSLDSARDSIASLVAELAEVSQGLSGLIGKLSAIGTPAILDSIAEARSDMNGAVSKSTKRLALLVYAALGLGALNLLGTIILAIVVLQRSASLP